MLPLSRRRRPAPFRRSIDPTDPEGQADTAATNNVTSLTASNGGIIATSGCSTIIRTPRGYVTVQYSYPQQLFFAGIFGQSTKTVVTEATAAWGPLAGGNAVPIVLESSQFQGPCDVPDITPPATCNFWYDNGNAAIGDANWGFLSLDPNQWGVAPTDNNVCSNVGREYAIGLDPPQLTGCSCSSRTLRRPTCAM